MARTIDMSQVSSRGTRSKYQSILQEVQGEVSVGDTLLLRDGAFTVTRVGVTFTNKQGFTEIEVGLKAQEG